MKIYNPFKKIKDLEYQLERLKEKNRDAQIELDRVLDRANGKNHKTGIWCQGCNNLITRECQGYYTEYFCKLDIKCPDRMEDKNGQ